MRSTYKAAFDPIKQEFSMIQKYKEDGKTDLETAISNTVMPSLEERIRVLSIRNMTSYSFSGTAPRHPTIVEAFKILEDKVGFEWNRDGSFTKTKAEEFFNTDVTILSSGMEMMVTASGRLEELEKSDVSWEALRIFFYSKAVKYVLYMYYPDAKTFYNRLTSLFTFTNDPTQPAGRTYISSAALKSSEILHKSIQSNIAKAFGEGKWEMGK